jgi:hypothetical protein
MRVYLLLCNGLFVSNRSLDQIYAQEFVYPQPDGPDVPMPQDRVEINYDLKAVAIGIGDSKDLIPTMRAAYREGIGCVVMGIDQTFADINKLPKLEMAPLPGDPAAIPWPDGDLVLRILAVQGDKRMKSIRDVPSMKELGIDAEWTQWLRISATRKAPAPIIARVREVVKKVTEDDAFDKLLESQGAEARYLTSEEVERFIKAESDVVGRIYKTLLAEEKNKK